MALDVSNLVIKKQAFTTTTGLNSVGTTNEHPYLLLRNPSSNDQALLITHSVIGVDANSVRTIWRAYARPTVTTDGTSINTINTYIAGSVPSSKAVCFKEPTVSSNGDLLNMYVAPANTPSRGISRFYIVDPGNEFLITIENSSANASSFADVYWVEW